MINDSSLAGFVANAVTHGRITFGDVRRLQRDYLPGGIETREQAEMLAEVAGKIEHADRSWKLWFAAALADFATKSAEGDAAKRDETIVWLERLSEIPGFSRRTSRKIARQLRGDAQPAETTAPAVVEAVAETNVDAAPPQEPAAPPAPCDKADDAERRKRTRAAKQSHIIVPRRPAKPLRSKHKRHAMPLATMPSLWLWPESMGEQCLQVPLAAQLR
jgi:hypothetical protein